MFLIDFYAQQLKRQNASQIDLQSGELISLQLPEGEKKSTSNIIHSQVVQLVEEIASPSDWQTLKETGSVSFEYPASGGKIGLSVNVIDDQNWQVSMAPAHLIATRAEPVPEAQAASSSISATIQEGASAAHHEAPEIPQATSSHPKLEPCTSATCTSATYSSNRTENATPTLSLRLA